MRIKSLLSSAAIAIGTLTFTAHSALAEALVVYSPQPAENMAYLEEQAEKALGFDIEFVTGGGGEIYDRLLAEKNNPQADVVYGLINLLMAGLKREGVTQAYENGSAEGLPGAFIDPDGHFYGYRQTPIALAYNAELIKAEDAPTDWLQLAEPEYKGKFVAGLLRWQTTRAIVAGLFTRLMEEDGTMTDDDWAWVEKFYNNAVFFQDGMDRSALIASGETPVQIQHYTGVLKDAKNGGYNVTLVDTVGGTPVVAESNGVVAGTDMKDKAVKFIEFASSVEWQTHISEKFGVIPAHPDAIAAAPESIRNNPAIKLSAQDINWDLISKNLDAWLEKIQLDYL